jgi:hypothetical protein
VAVLLAEVSDVRASGFEYPQAEQPGYSHQREILPVRWFPDDGEQGPGLQVREPERGRLGGDGGTADVLGG